MCSDWARALVTSRTMTAPVTLRCVVDGAAESSIAQTDPSRDQYTVGVKATVLFSQNGKEPWGFRRPAASTIDDSKYF